MSLRPATGGYRAFEPSALAALNSPNETDRKTRAQNTGQAQSLRGETGWDVLAPRLSLPLRC